MTALAEIRRPLALFAEGIAAMVLELDTDAQKGSEAVLLPESIEHFDDPEQNRRAFRLAALEGIARRTHGAEAFEFAVAMTMFTDLVPGVGEPVPVGTFSEHRHGSRVSDLERFLRLLPNPGFAGSVFEELETARIRSSLCRSYPGVLPDVMRSRRYELDQRESAHNDSPPPSVAVSFVDALRLWSCGLDGTLERSVQLLVEAVLEPEATVYRSMEICLIVCVHIALDPLTPLENEVIDATELAKLADELPDDTDSVGRATDGDGRSDSDDQQTALPAVDIPEGPGTAFVGDLADDVYTQAFSSSTPGEDRQGPNQWRSSPRGNLSETTEREPYGLRLSNALRPTRAKDRAYRYPEWDYHVARYRLDWCRLIERRIDAGSHEFMERVRRDHSTLRAQIKRRLSAIRPEQRIRVHGTSDGDELSIDAVIGAVVDRRAGQSPEDHLYIRRDPAERDVAAAFLIDLSRSTDSPVMPAPSEPKDAGITHDRYDPFGPGYWDVVDFAAPPVGRRVVDVAKEAVAVMCESLQLLGDRHAIYGFSGRSRQQVDFLVAKEFEDRPSARNWSALGAMEPMSYTRMGPAIRHTAAKLTGQGARTRILLVISDGYPQDEGYGPDPNDSDYGLHDTAQALREAESAGITTFCVTVDPAGHDYLRRMCPEHRYLVIDDMAALTSELEKVYAALTLR